MLNQQLQDATNLYQSRFGNLPISAAVAPGRVNLIGEHTDYNDGFVLPMAIERQTIALAGASDVANHITLVSSSQKEEALIDLSKPLAPGLPVWANYVRGVLSGFIKQGLTIRGVNILVDSTVPLGGGLSSSASLEVATATLLEALTGQKLSLVDKALLCQKAEHDFANTPCGIMDQFISVMAIKDHAMLLDCRTHATQAVPLQDPDIAVLVINSNVKHELSGGEYARRRRECQNAADAMGIASLRDASISDLEQAKHKMNGVAFRRARHVILENDRTLQAALVAKSGQWDAFGQLMYQSHASLKNDFEVSCDELDILVDLARDLGPTQGVFGARMTGGGFGGCTVNLVQSNQAEQIQAKITQAYQRQTGIRPSAFVTRAAPGACELTLPPYRSVE